MDACRLELLNLLRTLVHRIHEDHLGCERNDLLDVGLRAGLYRGHRQRLLGIVAILTASDNGVPSTNGIDDLTVCRREGNHARDVFAQLDISPLHIRDRSALGARSTPTPRKEQNHRTQNDDEQRFVSHIPNPLPFGGRSIDRRLMSIIS